MHHFAVWYARADVVWAVFVKDRIVFACTSLQHKLEFVKRAQVLGHIVGMTGDGMNNLLVLKKANLGIVMNI